MKKFSRSRRVATAAVAVVLAALTPSAASDPALVSAVRQKDGEAVRKLLDRGVNPNAPQGDGTTPLHWAAHLDELTIAGILLRGGARADVSNDLGFTPMHLACTNRNAPMVERLLAAGADPNATSHNGETVLMTCARSGSAGAVKALIGRGARVNDREKAHGQTALM